LSRVFGGNWRMMFPIGWLSEGLGLGNGYGVARGVIVILELIGWTTVAVGVMGGLYMLSEGSPPANFVLAAGVMLGGFLTVAISQIVKAQVATAESTAKILELVRQSVRNGTAASSQAAPVMASAPKDASVVAGGSATAFVIKRYRGKLIVREAKGVSVDGKGHYLNVLDAERAIDNGAA